MNKQITAIKTNVTIILMFVVMLILITNIHYHFKILQKLDLSVFKWFQDHFGNPRMNFHSGLFNDYMTSVAKYGDVATWLVLSIALGIVLMIRQHRLLGLWLILTVGSGGIFGMILKKLVHRARPYDHLIQDSGFSFPSGHALASTLVIAIILLLLIPQLNQKLMARILQVLLIIIWLSILISRLYFHAHFTTDVIGGVTLGLLWVMMAIKIYQLIITKFIKD